LVIASADQGRLPVREESLAVDQVFAAVVRRFAGRSAGPPQLELSLDPGLRVRADRLRLEEALANMLDNALRHGEEPVRLAATATEAGVELHVTDCGPGFPPGFAPHAFERFTRAGNGRSQEGTGLGLAIVDAIARAHGGRADAMNSEDGGADVVIVLPRA
jgi:signal transduction histidine kinase